MHEIPCPNGYKEGDFIPHPMSRQLFFICFNGELVEAKCGAGNYYDKDSQSCLPEKIERQHIEKIKVEEVEVEEEIEDTKSRRKRSVVHPRSLDADCCPGGYKNGDAIPHPNDCTRMLVCCSGEFKEQSCNAGDYFNPISKQCEQDVNKSCRTPWGPCEAGDQIQNPANCSSYYVCCSGSFREEFCLKGEYYSPVSNQCEPDTNNICWPKCSEGEPEDKCTEGENEPAEDCDKYYTCSNGELVLSECGINNYFDAIKGECLPDTKHVCWINLCANESTGTLLPNPLECDAFYSCKNGQSTIWQCPEGEYFDATELACLPDLQAVCYNPCASEQQITVLPHPSCNKFYWCNGNQTLVGTCNQGGFDESILACNPEISCSTNLCEGKPNYYPFPDPESTYNVYICINGVPVLFTCPNGTQFDGTVCAHASDPDCDAELCDTLSPYEAFPTLNVTDTNAFCMCVNGYANRYECPAEYIFSAEYGRCVSNEPCDPMICKTSPDFFVFANNNDTNSFCLCLNNEAIVVECPSGSYNPYTSSCTDVEISKQCDQLVCRNASDDYIYSADNSSLNGFCRCVSQVGVFEDCPANSQFDPTMNLCKMFSINCDSSQCPSGTDIVKIPALTTEQGYCECVNGSATYYNCENYGDFNAITSECDPPVCNPTECVGAPDGKAFPAYGIPTGFCLCESGKVQYYDCPGGGVFSNVTGACKVPLQNCNSNMCIGIANGDKVAALYTQYGYCLCNGNLATYEDCPNQWIFNADTQSCSPKQVPIENVCDVSYCNDPEATVGERFPSYNNVYGYCMCTDSGTTFVNCGAGEILDLSTMACGPSAASQCDLALCANATADNTYTTPAKSNNTLFCFCAGPDNVMLLSCPDGKYYSQEQQLCVSSIQEGCSCPNGLQNGDKAPDTSDCTQYYVCNSGSMRLQCCPTGQYFNIDANCCSVDNGTCNPNTNARTCVGAYREGERIIHPYNQRMYYVCENKMLHEHDCGLGRIFNQFINQCMRAPRIHNHLMSKRSVDVDEFFCINGEKRSVPSNCSQYEMCVNQNWKRQTCTNLQYYNPEQKKCLEPRDDTICEYARVKNLPECTSKMEQRLHPGHMCQQYFRCQKGKWRLKTCGKAQYFDTFLEACLPHGQGNKFKCPNISQSLIFKTQQSQCAHLSMRPYEENCAMYLMCLEDQWWYQYCPLGMYFNRSLNYCMPDSDNKCPKAIKSNNVTAAVEDFVKEKCSHEGVLRPSALACNRYYICIGGQWLQQQCASQEFYDVQHSKCAPDVNGLCAQLQMDCMPHEKRPFPLNCSAYEECSSNGQWQRMDCAATEFFDELLQRCVLNEEGLCSSRGLTRVCNERETRRVTMNCSQFYYCDKDNWVLGNCLKGHMYLPEKQTCIPHSVSDTCSPFHDLEMHLQTPLSEANATNICENQEEGASVPHPSDCTRYFICVSPSRPYEMQCSVGSFFDSSSSYCRPNDGSCRLQLTGACENATDGSFVAHPSDCQSYYSCSTLTGTELKHCPEDQYYHNFTRQCRVDHGECKGANGSNAKCANATHGTRLPHERYCNIYYACVKGLPIPVECPDHYQFNALLGKCLYDDENQCQDGQLVDSNQTTYSCGNLSDGSYLPDRKDCTRYYICSEGKAQPKKCAGSTFFDAEQLLCVPDDGSCPFVDDDEPNQHPVPPDPIVCEGKHGYLMPDPLNCNNFYVCLNSKLRHERCYPQHFFNASSNQCHPKMEQNEEDIELSAEIETKIRKDQCWDNITSVEQMCLEYPPGSTLAELGDCRFFITCQQDDVPIAQKCRNGESYDSLLGFCRQNDGTCLLENGKRVGECNDRHGQLARDANHCRQYFTCINGQKIPQTCQEHEYFSKSQNMCLNDTLKICNPEQEEIEEIGQQSCAGLSESVLYPYIYDNCRSYFQCVKGVAKIHQCADDLYFDPVAIKCVKEPTECVMPQKNVQRTQDFKRHTYEELCLGKENDKMYANVENKCRSYYICRESGEVVHELCPLGMAYDKKQNQCVPQNKAICL